MHREASQRQEMGESGAHVSPGAQAAGDRSPGAGGRFSEAEVAALAAEALRHLAWLESAGVRELPSPTPQPPPQLRWRGGGGYTDQQPTPGHAFLAGESAGRAAPPRVEGGLATGSRDALPQDGQFAGDKGCGSPELLRIRRELGECARCKLAGGRHNLVFGVGNPSAELVFVGEGPGEDEDRQGEPFVGRAGQLLTKMIEAMGFARADVYIANVVKCRPPGNRNPEPDEIEACEPFLRAQLAAIGPRVIVALGKFAAQTLLRTATPISRLRGRWAEYGGVKLMPTFHPAYLLRSPDEKKKAWEDLQLVMKELGKPLPRR